MHSQKRGLLRPHSAGGGWLSGPLPIFVLLALLIFGMYFFYSYNSQSNELEILREKFDSLTRTYRALHTEETASKAKIEQLTSDLASVKNDLETKESECDSEVSKLHADIIENKHNMKKINENAEDFEKTISKLRDQLTECRSNSSALIEHGQRQDETIQRLNQTILSSRSSAKETKTVSTIDEKTEERKSIDQAGQNDRIGSNTDVQSEKKPNDQADQNDRLGSNTNIQSEKKPNDLAGQNDRVGSKTDIQSEKNTDVKVKEGETVEEKAVEGVEKVANGGRLDDKGDDSLRGERTGERSDKEGDKENKETDKKIDSNPRRPAEDSVKETNQIATDLKSAGDVGDDSIAAPKQPARAEVAFKKSGTDSEAKPAVDAQEEVVNRKDKEEVVNRKDKAEIETPTAVKSVNVSDDGEGADHKGENVERSEDQKDGNRADEKEVGVGQAPPSSKDALIGDDEKDNQVKAPKIDQKSAEYGNEDAPQGSTTAASRVLHSTTGREADKPFDSGKEMNDDDQGAVDFEGNEERINQQPVGRYNRLESGA